MFTNQYYFQKLLMNKSHRRVRTCNTSLRNYFYYPLYAIKTELFPMNKKFYLSGAFSADLLQYIPIKIDLLLFLWDECKGNR